MNDKEWQIAVITAHPFCELTAIVENNPENYNKALDSYGENVPIFKNINEFYSKGLDSYIGFFGTEQHIPNSNLHGYYFDFQIKHSVHEIFEVEVVETMRKITL
jgi:hypothetical protein